MEKQNKDKFIVEFIWDDCLEIDWIEVGDIFSVISIDPKTKQVKLEARHMEKPNNKEIFDILQLGRNNAPDHIFMHPDVWAKLMCDSDPKKRSLEFWKKVADEIPDAEDEND